MPGGMVLYIQTGLFSSSVFSSDGCGAAGMDQSFDVSPAAGSSLLLFVTYLLRTASGEKGGHKMNHRGGGSCYTSIVLPV